ncbi:MAG: tetratricopeptide repeat protein [Candidatus Promineifilaceae bacterium]|nr:tetratricopeptide repeat protein [Candidatus Promineifilaceae bacterium]
MAQIPLQDYLEEIDTLIDESRLGEAIAHCRHILEHYPRYVGAYRLLGKAFLEQNAYADAADVFRRVLSADPEDFLAHVGLAIVHKQDEAFSEALWHMERAFEQDPYNPAIQEEMKELYGRRDGLAPEQVPLTRGALARLYVKGGLYQQAVAELHDLLAAGTERLDLEALLAEALWRDGRRVDAVERCQDILARLPLCIKANAILAEVWLLTGREDEAQEYLQRLQELTRLSRDQLSGDTPPVRAFRADGATLLPEQVLIERLPEDKAFGAASAGEEAGWVQEIDFEGSEALDEDFDWLEAMQGEPEEAEVAAALLDDDSEEEVMDWLRDVAAQGEATDEMADEPADVAEAEHEMVSEESGRLAESVEDSEKAVTDDLPDWFEEVGDEEVDLGATADWFSEPVAGEAGFDEEMEWEAWMASGREEAPVGDEDEDEDWLAGIADEDETEFESEPALEDDSFPDWLQDEEEAAAAADEAGSVIEADVQAGDTPDGQLQVEELAMGTTDDHGNEWEEHPDEEAHHSDRPEAEETTPDEDLDWLDELKEAGETEQAGEDLAAAAPGDLPDWLRDEMEDAADSGETLDWLEEAHGEGSMRDDKAEELPAGDMPEWLQEEAHEVTSDASDEDEGEVLADDDLSWLDQIAAGAGEPIEEGPTMEWPETESGESEIPGDVPPEPAASEEEAPSEASPEISFEGSEGEGSEETPGEIEGAPETTAGAAEAEGVEPAEATDVPEDLDDAMDWLEQMAAEGEPAGEPETAAEMEAETGLDWLDELAVGAGDEEEGLEAMPAEDASASEEDSPVGERDEIEAEPEIEEPAATAGDQVEPEQEAAQIEETLAAEPEEADDLDWLDEMAAEDEGRLEDLPEDEDLVDAEELESLLGAAEPGADEVELEGEPVAEEPEPSLPEEEPILEEAPTPEEVAEPQEAAAEAPEDEDETDLDWLDEIAAEEIDGEEGLPGDEDFVGDEEAETPLEAAEERPPEAAELPVEEPAEEPTEVSAEVQPEDLSDVPEDEEEAMAWLEQLAAKQGASLDELPSLQETEPPTGEEHPDTAEEAPDWLDELDVEEAEAEPEVEAQAPEIDAGEEEPVAEEDLEWLDDLVAGAEEEAAEEDVDWLAEEEAADAEAAAEMEAAVEEDLSWLDDLETEEAEAEAEAVAEPETSEDVDEAMAWLEELAAEEEGPVEAEAEEAVPETAAPDDVIAGLSDEIPDDPDEALAWLEQLAGAEAAEAPETPVVEEQSTPVAPQDVVAARAQAEAAALHEETPAAEEEDFEADQEAAPVEAEAEYEEALAEPAVDEEAEPAMEAPAVDEAEVPEEMELFAEEAGLDIPEDPDEAMAWLERLAARQGASLDELPSVETAEGDVETPEWIAREMEETAEAEETIAPEEPVVEEEAVAEEQVPAEAEEEPVEEEPLEELPAFEDLDALEEEIYPEEAAAIEEEAAVPEDMVAPEDAVLPEDVASEEMVEEEPPAEELAVEEEPAEEPEPTFAEDLDDDFLGELTEEDFDDSLPDWLKVDEGAGFGWGDAESDVTSWLQAEEEATQYDLEVPEGPAGWETPEEVESVTEEEAPPIEEEMPAPGPLPPAATLDLDQERLESARAALDAGDVEAAVSDYRALLDAGEGMNALIAEMEIQVAAHKQASLHELLGDTYMRNGQLQKALDAYRQALDQL